MNFCEQCGAELLPDANFCEYCGARVASQPDVQNDFLQDLLAPTEAPTELLNYEFNEDEEFDADSEDETVLLVQYKPARLVRLSNNKVMDIVQDELVVGKSSYSDFYIGGNNTVSRRHAIIFRRDGEYYLKDNKSLNGTYINNVQIEPDQEIRLDNGDIIRLSDEDLRFEIDE